MSLSEKKKALRKAKKAELKNAENSADSNTEDPFGSKLLEGDPLMNAMPFLSSLLEYSPETLKAQVLGAQVYMRRSMYIH